MSSLTQADDGDVDVTYFVNTFIGTSKGGNTFPGAVLPWGMVSVSPHNTLDAPSGYLHGKPYFYGFGMVHLSGTGCADLGSIIVVATRGTIRSDPEAYKCTYSNEKASPGYYSTVLQEPKVLAEATVTERCGMIKLTSLEDGELNLLVDVGRCLSLQSGGTVTVDSNTEAAGFNIGGKFCGEANRHKIYFAMKLGSPATAKGVWVKNQVKQEMAASIQDAPIGAWFRLNTVQQQTILIKVGISYVSVANARENMNTEIPDWDFERVKNDAKNSWQQQLSRIRVWGGTDTDYIKFYTAMYHALIHPNIISDINGEYPLMGQTGIGRYTGRKRYTVFSLWDTYRTLHPLLTLVYPEIQSAMLKTMVDMAQESGWLPKWELAGNETYVMVGDPAALVISDSYLKGIRDFNIHSAYEAMKKPTILLAGEEAPPVRTGYHELLKYKYIPLEQDRSKARWVWGPVSTSLEYCFADWAIAQMANELDHVSDAQMYYRRSLYYRNLFDPETKFIRPKLKNGQWLTPFDPQQMNGSSDWAGSGGPGYVEGNAWNYTWFVPHDIDGLIELFGGQDSFSNKLQQCFKNGYFTITNEPDIAYPYLFTYLSGQEHKTQKIINNIMKTDFTIKPDGLPGNDDTGTISCWFIFSALGFYPACPASPDYRIGIPLFERAEIRLDHRYYPGKQFIIEARGKSPQDVTSKSVQLNGKEIPDFKIFHNQVVAGGKLVFNFSDD